MKTTNLKIFKQMKKAFLLLLFLFAFQCINLFGQADWEEVIAEDFSSASNIANVPNLESGSFILFGYGASGGVNDQCALSKTFSGAAFLAFQVNLTDDKEYRFSYKVKSQYTNQRKFQFRYNTVPGYLGTDIGQPVVIDQVANDGSGVEKTSDVFSGLDGVYSLIIAVGANSSGPLTANVRFDDFKLESKSLVLATCNFLETAMQVEEGASTEVCVTLDSEVDVPVEINVSLEGPPSPHFDDFTSQSLTFAPGEIQQCFDLATDADNGIEDENFVYNFSLSSSTEGVFPGEQVNLTVTVLEGDGCPFAGVDQTICEGQCVTIGCPQQLETSYCYKWIPETGMADGYEFLPNPTVCPEETTTYTIYVTDHQGNIVGTDEVTITVTHFDFTISPDPAVICSLEDPLMLDAGEEYIDFVWTDAEGEEIGYEQFLPVTEAGIYSVEVMTGEGCKSNASINVTAAVPMVTINAAPPVLCTTESSTVLEAPPGFESYLWTNVIGETLGTGTSLPVDLSGDYTLLVTDGNGCQATATQLIDESSVMDIEVTPTDPALCVADPAFTDPGALLEKNNDVCANSLTLEAIAAGNELLYEWLDESGVTVGYASTLDVAQSGMYQLIVTDGYGCSSQVEVEVAACTETELNVMPELPKVLGDGTPLTLDAGEGFQSYGWSDGSFGQTLIVTEPGEYDLTVTDFNGCSNIETIEVGLDDPSATVDVEVYKPAVIAGNTTTMVNDMDGMTFVNLDNDDKDKKFDNMESEVTGNGVTEDDELMRIKLKLKTTVTGASKKVIVEALSGGNDIKLWNTADKSGGEYSIGDEIELTVPEGEFFVKELWVEGIQAHTVQRATELSVKYSPSQHQEIKLTIVGVKELSWEGIQNGFDPVTNHTSSTLDEDSNFSTPVFSNLKAYRVFPNKKFIPSGSTVTLSSDVKNKVKLKVELTVAPVYPFDLYIRVFDVDDPSSNKGPVDPNDKAISGGNYSGPVGYNLSYSPEEDNRGEVNGEKFGKLDGDGEAGDVHDGIVALTFNSGDLIKEIEFEVSNYAGDNYQIVANSDKDFLDDLGNKDKEDRQKIVNLPSSKAIQSLMNYASPVLTVWRLLYIEFDSMDNLTPNDNRVDQYFTDFNSDNPLWTNKASTAKIVTGLQDMSGTSVSLKDKPIYPGNNLASLDLDYSSGTESWLGRFENGEILIGDMPDVIGVVGNGGAKIELKKDILKSSNPLGFQISDTAMPPNIITSGTVKEIIKLSGGGFEFELNMPSGSLSTVTNLDQFSVGGGTPLTINSINSVDNKLTTSDLKVPFILWDDDARSSDNILPNDLSSYTDELSVYNDAYIQFEKVPPSINVSSIMFWPDFIFSTQVPSPGANSQQQDLKNAMDISRHTIQGGGQESDDFWIAHIFAGFQSGYWRKDADCNKEEGVDPINKGLSSVNLGLTESLSDTIQIVRGGNSSIIPLENFRDTGEQSLIKRSISHELGHQFGLGHKSSESNLMNPALNSQNDGKLLDLFLNFLRSRRRSPGMP